MGSGRGFFVAGLAVVATVVVLAVYQVPQPWRGALVGWLLFVATAGVLALRMAGHYVQLRALGAGSRPAESRRTSSGTRRGPRRRATDIRVVVPQARTGARHVIR